VGRHKKGSEEGLHDNLTDVYKIKMRRSRGSIFVNVSDLLLKFKDKFEKI
jgi:hypothetical protein